MYIIYSFLLTLAAFLGIPYWIYRAVKESKYVRNFRQRQGLRLPEIAVAGAPLWIHAVSVGEVLAAQPLLTALRAAKPDVPVVVSTVTLTGHALAEKELSQADAVFYFPFDWAFSVRRFLGRLRPRAVVLMETEMWPNFLRLCSQAGIPVFIANGRISDKSFRRYRWIKWLTRRMLGMIKVSGVQTGEDMRRFIELGAEEGRTRLTGNLKYDFSPAGADSAGDLLRGICACLGLSSDRHAIVIGSSMKGEEELFLDAFRSLRDSAAQPRLILAPRHPERFEEVAELIGRTGLPFQRRTELHRAASGTEVLLLDSIGELRAVYALASIAVIGGSFLPFGGHNPLEPAAFGKAIVFGPEMSNFREMAALFLREEAARQCSPAELPSLIADLLTDADARATLGRRAEALSKRNQGATKATVGFLLPDLE